MGNRPDHAIRDIASKFSIFLPPRAIYFRSYHYETPCISNTLEWGTELKVINFQKDRLFVQLEIELERIPTNLLYWIEYDETSTHEKAL